MSKSKSRLFILCIISIVYSQQHDHSFLHRFLPGFSLWEAEKTLNVSYQINNTLSYIYTDPDFNSDSFDMMVDMEMHAFDIQYRMSSLFSITTGISISTQGFSDEFIYTYHRWLNIGGREFTQFGMNKNHFFLDHSEIYKKAYLRPISISLLRTSGVIKYAFTFSHQFQDLYFVPKNIFSTQILYSKDRFSFNGNFDLSFGFNQLYSNTHFSYQLSYEILEDHIELKYYYTSPLFKQTSLNFSRKDIQLTMMGYNYLYKTHTLIGINFKFMVANQNIHLELLEDYVNLFGKKLTNRFLTHTNAPDFAIRLKLMF